MTVMTLTSIKDLKIGDTIGHNKVLLKIENIKIENLIYTIDLEGKNGVRGLNLEDKYYVYTNTKAS